mgnify:CR=1 FL=1
MTPDHRTSNRRFLTWAALLMLACSPLSVAQDDDGQAESVATEVEQLRKQVIELNRDLFVLEEDLLFPASTQFAVFLSVETGEFLSLDAVKLKVGDDVVASHLYTARQVDALRRGGMQRLHMGNLKTGEHEVTVFVDGIGPENRPYRKAATYQLDKGTGTATLEVRIRDRSSDYQPAVELMEWE